MKIESKADPECSAIDVCVALVVEGVRQLGNTVEDLREYVEEVRRKVLESQSK